MSTPTAVELMAQCSRLKATKGETVKVYLLNSGSLVIDRSNVLWNIDPGNPVRFPVYSVLIDHPEELFLFDTGYDYDHVQRVLPFEEPIQQPNETIPEQLKLCGYAPDDIPVLVNSHLHFDHVGGNRFFTKGKTVLHRKELEQGRNPEPFERYGYSDKQWDHADANFETIEGDLEIAKGLHLYETPGHTIGHYSLLVQFENRQPILFSFDAAYTHENLEKEIQSSFHIDPVAGVRSIRRVKQLAKEHNAEIFVSHEMEAFQTYKKAPDCYEG
jgi:4-pyridoxolactonase